MFKVVSLREVVRLRRVGCAPRRLLLRSSHHPRRDTTHAVACITSLIERYYLAHSDITSRRDITHAIACITSLKSDITSPTAPPYCSSYASHSCRKI